MTMVACNSLLLVLFFLFVCFYVQPPLLMVASLARVILAASDFACIGAESVAFVWRAPLTVSIARLTRQPYYMGGVGRRGQSTQQAEQDAMAEAEARRRALTIGESVTPAPDGSISMPVCLLDVLLFPNQPVTLYLFEHR